jgi:hypothetical protein
VDKQRWDQLITPHVFDIGDHVLMRHENKICLEFNWFGPLIVLQRNLDKGIYKLEYTDGFPYTSWVHIDRLTRAHSSDPPESWYKPAAARAQKRVARGRATV